MKECPICHYVEEKSDNKPWKEFLFTEEMLPAFKLILGKMLMIEHYANATIEILKRRPTYLKLRTFDEEYVSCVLRDSGFISLSCILEYFHKTRIAPNSSVLRNTKFYDRLSNLRDHFAHIINDEGKLGKAMNEIIEPDVIKIFEKTTGELLKFVRDGFDVYYEMGKFKVEDFKNTEEGRNILRIVNEHRQPSGKKPIWFM
jgi:hypothetical protein